MNIADLFPDASEDLARLHRVLERSAERDGILDVAYRTIDTPVGALLLAATEVGLVRVAYASQGFNMVLADLANRISPRILCAPARLDSAAHEIDEYFSGRRTHFDLPLDLALSTGFRRKVLEHLRELGYGARESYAAVAAGLGNPRAVRAVGTACGHNPIPVVIPCHRVVRSDGTLGGYIGGIDAKNILLTLEAA